MPGPVLSVIIPAHDESAVIDRCLSTLLDGVSPGEFDVWVVANGCTDDTARRATAHGVNLLDLASPGKTGALQAGDTACSTFPRIYLDADVQLTAEAARAVAHELGGDGEIQLAAPRPAIDVAGCSRPVAMFYRTWQRLPWLQRDPVGNGVFALSAQGRAAFAEWPPIIADDLFAAQLFPDGARRCLTEVSFLIRPPRRLRALLAVRRRVVLGNDELKGLRAAGSLPPAQNSDLGTGRALGDLLRGGDRLAVLVYVAVVLAGRVSAALARRRGDVGWDRDDTSRT